jgi:CHASE2 domain-containing sensor protein
VRRWNIVVGWFDILFGVWFGQWFLRFEELQRWTVFGYGLSLVVCGALVVITTRNRKPLGRVFFARALLYMLGAAVMIYGVVISLNDPEVLPPALTFFVFFAANGILSLYLRRQSLKRVRGDSA